MKVQLIWSCGAPPLTSQLIFRSAPCIEGAGRYKRAAQPSGRQVNAGGGKGMIEERSVEFPFLPTRVEPGAVPVCEIDELQTLF
jgi:hypothetical protein